MTSRGVISKSEGILLPFCNGNFEDELEENGLGERYLKKLSEHNNSLHQVQNTITRIK